MMITISVSPIAFTIGTMSIRWYGIMVALAVLTIILWMIRQHRTGAKLTPDSMLNAALVAIPSGVIISRLLHVVDRWDYYSQNPGQIIGASGLTIYGAILGATLGLWVCSKLSKFQFGYFVDVMAPSIILAQAVGRVGCTLNGCCYGTPTSLPWGIVYTHPESFAFGAGVIHPTQIYEIIYNLIVFAVLLKLRGRFKPDGSLFLIYLSLYSIWRFSISFLREESPFLFGLPQAQVIAIIVLAIIIPILAYRTRWIKAETKPS